MKTYCGRRVRIYAYGGLSNNVHDLYNTGEIGILLEIDVHNEQVMVENKDGELIKLFYKLVKLI